MKEDKKLFKLGNKLWIQGDNNLTDCIYIINTSVKEDIFKENSFTFEAEEVLVELTYAPVFSHLEFTSTNGFKVVNNGHEGEKQYYVDYNSLNYWFGKYFNIGVVQKPVNYTQEYITFSGTITPMNLLRLIEEQTGNVFITRYEKDVLDNTIHRYLDYLNPINVSKDWNLHLEYRFVNVPSNKAIYDEDDQLTDDDTPFTVKPYSTDMPSESLVEHVKAEDEDIDADYEGFTDTLYQETWIEEEQVVDDPEMVKNYTPMGNITPANIKVRITDGTHLLNSDGQKWKTGDTALEWDSTTIGLTNENKTVLISLMKVGNLLGVDVNNKSFVVPSDTDIKTDYSSAYYTAIKNNTLNPSYIQEDGQDVDISLPDDCYFEIYDFTTNTTLFKTCINRSIGSVQHEVLDLGFNLENVIHNIDETDTYTAVAPVLSLDENNNNGLNKSQFETILSRWQNLEITKGQTIPMMVQKVTINKSSLEAAKVYLGNYVENSGATQSTSTANWWCRPFNPNDQAGSSYEFMRGTAYWKAPYSKKKNQLYVETDKSYATEFTEIHQRSDMRTEKGIVEMPKTGTTTSNDEDVYAIYNQVANYLKEHETPKIELDLDVANLRNGNYNQYQVWDKVYVKIPDTDELITCRVVEISKQAHDVAKNTIKVNNYDANTLKVIPKKTIIHTSNVSYKYPNSSKVTVRLENVEYTEGDVQYPAVKLLNFTWYKVENGSSTFLKNYTRFTDAYGYASMPTKLLPGDYKVEVSFGGDEEFAETTSTLKVSVGGKVPVKKQNKSSTKSKTTKKTTKKVTKTTYYDKYGRSPDKKKILAIGKISASGDEGSYANYYGQEFKNYCPHCGKSELVWGIFWAGENTNYGYFDGTGGKEGGSIEGHIFCKSCDADYSCQGHEHVGGGKTLTTTKKRFLSSKNDAYDLKKGKYVYNKVETSAKQKNNNNTKTRKIIGQPSKKIKNLALSIVGEKTGYQAMRAICEWMDKKISYHGYNNFCRSPDDVVNRGGGNCCDQTRLLLNLFDAAGLSEYYKMYYIHVQCPEYGHVYAQMENKSNGKKVYIDPASDAYACYGYICDSCPHGSPASRYPSLPF